MNNKLNNIFQNLEGVWTLNRTILNVIDNNTETAEGVAIFFNKNLNDLTTLNYEEKGRLSIQNGQKHINFNRKYIYRLKEESIDIILDDGVTKGKLFQTLFPNDDMNDFNSTEHICRLDKHNGKHIIHNESSFSNEYTVKGPNSDLKIKTHYVKNNN
ncbi:DUF6314 family protein [Flammeovirga sp. SJP92]|uniref:DUF6314 family protein n=1 Tax=Flammeovirga sp. SJP92 TaxID=1775430 RepID=UPI000788D09B|nr:DUF6314 family protein [Flammeovirga sp. SJP92]KXX66501.1 hypothetical protein AVL50_31740 [Flammeovirga sp. SJP92]